MMKVQCYDEGVEVQIKQVLTTEREVYVYCGYLAQSAGWAPCFCATALAWNWG